MILTLYFTYITFSLIAFGSLVSFIWSVSHSLAILTGGFTILAIATKILGELYLVKKREAYLKIIQAEYDKQQQHVVPNNTIGMN